MAKTSTNEIPHGMRKLESKNLWAVIEPGARIHGRALSSTPLIGDDGKERSLIKAKLLEECKVKVGDAKLATTAKVGSVVTIDVKADVIALNELVQAGEKPEFLIVVKDKIKNPRDAKKTRWVMDVFVDNASVNDETPF